MMKKVFAIPLTLVALAAAYLGVSQVQAQTAPTISIAPATQNAGQSSTAKVDVNISGATNVGSYDVEITFDPTLVQVATSGVVAGPFLASTGNTAVPTVNIDNTAGKVTFGAFSFGSNDGPSGSGTLNSITFNTLAKNGTASLTMTVAKVTSKADGSTINATKNNGSIVVGAGGPTATPRPATPTPTRPPASPTPNVCKPAGSSCNTSAPNQDGCCAGLSCVPVSGTGGECIADNPTATPKPPTPTTGSTTPVPVNLTVKFRLQGITTNTGAQSIHLTFKNGSQTLHQMDVTGTPDTQGNHTVTVSTLPSSVPVGTYTLCVKAKSHLQKCYPSVNVSTGSVTIDKTATELPVGDVDGNNTISLEDPAKILALYTSFVTPVSKPKAEDVNHDGRITIDDLALAIMNYSDFNIPGDQ